MLVSAFLPLFFWRSHCFIPAPPPALLSPPFTSSHYCPPPTWGNGGGRRFFKLQRHRQRKTNRERSMASAPWLGLTHGCVWNKQTARLPDVGTTREWRRRARAAVPRLINGFEPLWPRRSVPFKVNWSIKLPGCPTDPRPRNRTRRPGFCPPAVPH